MLLVWWWWVPIWATKAEKALARRELFQYSGSAGRISKGDTTDQGESLGHLVRFNGKEDLRDQKKEKEAEYEKERLPRRFEDRLPDGVYKNDRRDGEYR